MFALLLVGQTSARWCGLITSGSSDVKSPYRYNTEKNDEWEKTLDKLEEAAANLDGTYSPEPYSEYTDALSSYTTHFKELRREELFDNRSDVMEYNEKVAEFNDCIRESRDSYQWFKHAERGELSQMRIMLDSRISDVDIRGENRWTALFIAVIHNRKSVVEWLLKQGADRYLEDADGAKPEDYATRQAIQDLLEDRRALQCGRSRACTQGTTCADRDGDECPDNESESCSCKKDNERFVLYREVRAQVSIWRGENSTAESREQCQELCVRLRRNIYIFHAGVRLCEYKTVKGNLDDETAEAPSFSKSQIYVSLALWKEDAARRTAAQTSSMVTFVAIGIAVVAAVAISVFCVRKHKAQPKPKPQSRRVGAPPTVRPQSRRSPRE